MTNNTPTAPGFWYRENSILYRRVVYVDYADVGEGLVYFEGGSDRPRSVTDDGLWAGPVPMPGAPCGKCHDTGEITDDVYGVMDCDACSGFGPHLLCPHCGEVIA